MKFKSCHLSLKPKIGPCILRGPLHGHQAINYHPRLTLFPKHFTPKNEAGDSLTDPIMKKVWNLLTDFYTHYCRLRKKINLVVEKIYNG